MNTTAAETMSEVRVEFYAHLSEKFGSTRTVSLKTNANAMDLLDLLRSLKPEAAGLLAVCRIATDERILNSGEILPARVCVFPPMSGG